jgi:predicted nucleotidyltransferase
MQGKATIGWEKTPLGVRHNLIKDLPNGNRGQMARWQLAAMPSVTGTPRISAKHDIFGSMGASLADDPILKRFRAALDKLYGDRVERVVLFGSRARGDAQQDSDYDVAVFLEGLTDRWQEVDRIVPLVTEILYEDGAFIHAMPHPAGSYENSTALMREIRREGIDL